MKTITRPSFRRSISVALPFLLLIVLASAPAEGASGGSSGGTVYFLKYAVGQPGVQPTLNRMNSDGSGKSPLLFLQEVSHSTEPSKLLHGGRRWFLTLQTIAGQSYPSGAARQELFAVRDDGVAVQLSDQPDLQPFDSGSGFARWQADDEIVSWIAARWLDGVVVAGGIYAAEILFDAAGNLIGLAGQPLDPIVPAQIAAGLQPDVRSHDWSPDGSRIVFDAMAAQGSPRQLFIANLAIPQTVLLPTTTWAAWPTWSPDNTKIAFNSAGTNFSISGSIITISPSGAAEKTIVARTSSKSNSRPRWSPTGSHIIYEVADKPPTHGYDYAREDVYRAKADGSSKVNLTKDLDTAVFGGTPTRGAGWR